MPRKKQPQKSDEIPMPPVKPYDYSKTQYHDLDEDLKLEGTKTKPITEKQFFGEDYARLKKLEKERLSQYEKDMLAYQKAGYYREGERIDKINKRAEDKKKKRQRENEERVRFARNYFARDYVQNITNWTAAKERPKGYEYTRSGLRMEAVSKGFTDPQSGLLAVDTATQQRKGSLVTSKGSLRIGTGSLISGFNAGVANMKLPINNVTLGLRFGKGDVIMPSQVLKFKKRKI